MSRLIRRLTATPWRVTFEQMSFASLRAAESLVAIGGASRDRPGGTWPGPLGSLNGSWPSALPRERPFPPDPPPPEDRSPFEELPREPEDPPPVPDPPPADGRSPSKVDGTSGTAGVPPVAPWSALARGFDESLESSSPPQAVTRKLVPTRAIRSARRTIAFHDIPGLFPPPHLSCRYCSRSRGENFGSE